MATDIDLRMLAILARLKTARTSMGLSVYQAARLMDVPSGRIVDWEGGDTPIAIKTLLRLSELYETSLMWVMTGEVNGGQS